MLKDAADELSAPLCRLINKSLQASLFPTSEKCGKITPVFKSGNSTLLDNYRPITVIPALSKVIEKIVYNQLSQYLESNGLLCPRQFGFRQGRSTQHAVTLLSEKVRQNIDKWLRAGALSLPNGTVNKLQYIQDRAARIVSPRANVTAWESVEKTRNTRVAIDVFKSLHHLLPEDLNGNFKSREHAINTRANGSCIILPKMRTETGKK
eukprot:gene789-79_t